MLAEHKLSQEVIACYDTACKTPLVYSPTSKNPLTKQDICNIMHHRPPFLLLDRIIYCDTAARSMVGVITLSESNPLFEGHSPKKPLFPSSLQLEAIGQAGLLLALMEKSNISSERGGLTHVCAARFLAPVSIPQSVYVNVSVFSESVFFTAVGQIVRNNEVCSAAIIRGLL